MKFTANYTVDHNILPLYVESHPELKNLVLAQEATVRTCEDYIQELHRQLDYDPAASAAIELFIRLTGPERHSQRVLATFIEAGNLTSQVTSEFNVRAWLARTYLICMLDNHGLRTYNKVGTEFQQKTSRVLYRLGKGRWHASDGPAWAAALREILWAFNWFTVRPVENSLYIIDPEEFITKVTIDDLRAMGVIPWVKSFIETEMVRLWHYRYSYDEGTWANWALNYGLLYEALL